MCWHTRGAQPYQRIDLAAAHIPEPGAEAATAVTLLRDVHRPVGSGAQAVVYDGALRGVHIEQIMRSYGYPVLAKQHADAAAEDQEGTRLVQTPTGRRARSYPLGTVTHQLPTGPCTHQIGTAAGKVVEIDLDEAGDPVITATLTRRAVKRSRRTGGHYHFNVGYQLDCPLAPVTVWLSPHPGRDETDTRRPENLRILAAGDPDAQRLYGIRSDADSFHSNYKRTLIVNRALSLGWRRGLIDLYCFTLLNNALTEHRATQQAATTGATALRASPHDRHLDTAGPA